MKKEVDLMLIFVLDKGEYDKVEISLTQHFSLPEIHTNSHNVQIF